MSRLVPRIGQAASGPKEWNPLIFENERHGSMTAIIRTLTQQGFALVADGRLSDCKDDSVISDDVQKIFPLISSGGVLALSFCGADGLTSFDTGDQLKFPQLSLHCAESLSGRKTGSSRGYAIRLARCIKEGIDSFRVGGPIHLGASAQPSLPGEAGDTIFRLGLDGFDNTGKPVLIDLRFFLLNGELREPEIRSDQPLIGFHRVFAPCPMIAEILWLTEDDGRLSSFRGPLKYVEQITLQDALERSSSFIRAHSDPEAVALDRKCRTVGGHIHAATISPQDGFKWIIPPKT